MTGGKYETILLHEFTSVVASELDVALTFVLFKDGKQHYYRADLEERAANSLRGIVVGYLQHLKRLVSGAGVTVQLYYPPARLEDHEIEYLDVAEGSALHNRLAPLGFPKRLDAVTDDDLRGPHLQCYVISLQPADGPWLHCFRLITRGSQPQRSRVAIIKGHGTGYFDTLTDPVYYLDPHNIDCMWRGEHLFVIDKDNFERIFDLEAETRDIARTVISSVMSRLPFVNLDEFILACQRDRRMAAKVARMKDMPHLERLSIEKAKLAKERFDLDIEFERAPDGAETLRFVARYKWQYVSILGDEYVTSPVTGMDYEANSKRPIKKHSQVVGARRRLQDLTTATDELPRNSG